MGLGKNYRCKAYQLLCLKALWHKILTLDFSPRATEYPVVIMSNFYKNSRIFANEYLSRVSMKPVKNEKNLCSCFFLHITLRRC